MKIMKYLDKIQNDFKKTEIVSAGEEKIVIL